MKLRYFLTEQEPPKKEEKKDKPVKDDKEKEEPEKKKIGGVDIPTDKLAAKELKNKQGWIGVDLDSTLAHHEKFEGIETIGEPIGDMVQFVKQLLEQGKQVKIFTSRANIKGAGKYIATWLKDVAKLPPMEVTATKDAHCIAIYDDIAHRVEKNTGKILN
jgi:hypothetical protein